MDKRSESDKELFDRIAALYAKKDLYPASRMARKQRLEQSLQGLATKFDRILEVGCGAGFAAEYLAHRYDKYVGVDHSQELVNAAEAGHGSPSVSFVAADIRDYEAEEKFDLILMIGVLHHLSEPGEILNSLSSLLKKDGVLVVNEPQKGNPIIGLARSIRKVVDNNYSSDQVEFSAAELEKLFRDSNYSTKLIPQGVWSTPFAETTFLPTVIAWPMAWIATACDPMAEKLLFGPLSKMAWNVIVQARPNV